jgi:F1F0 ATPase subunit 2
MNDALGLASAVAAGGLLGAFFYGGLWWTVRQGVSSGWVALWFAGSMLLRTVIVVLGFYFILGDSWLKLLTGLIGFVIARFVVTRLTHETRQSSHTS